MQPPSQPGNLDLPTEPPAFGRNGSMQPPSNPGQEGWDGELKCESVRTRMCAEPGFSSNSLNSGDGLGCGCAKSISGRSKCLLETEESVQCATSSRGASAAGTAAGVCGCPSRKEKSCKHMPVIVHLLRAHVCVKNAASTCLCQGCCERKPVSEMLQAHACACIYADQECMPVVSLIPHTLASVQEDKRIM
eukprot:1154160-Pelagomonas_calceolata.AAC.1